MRGQDRQLLAELARVNTALPAFADKIMTNSATVTEHEAVATSLITLARAITTRGRDLTVITTAADDKARDLAATDALLALVDALNSARARRSAYPACGSSSVD
jgi:hypothetical protein